MVRLSDVRYEVRPEPQHDPAKKHQANAVGLWAPAIVLSHDCEIDKNPKRATLLLALARPLDGVPDDAREGFRNNTRQRAFYLGAPEQLDGAEYYADLRIITTIRRVAFDDLDRVATINEDGRRMLREHLFRFFARRVLPEEWLGWQEDA